MRRNRQKRMLALALALALALPLLVAPGSAAGRFQDVEDDRVALAADTLAALGVVSGTGDGKFSPGGHLTRAQLCKMAVELLGMREQAEAQTYRTIFTDMGRHWARGYVNVAATTQVPAESGVRLMLGLGNGKFGPDQTVTYQEAATLALRILGYGAEANRAWPHSAVETASLLGLDRGMSVGKPSDPINRGQTALLFYNMLTIPAKGEDKPCAGNLGQVKEDSILLSADATLNGRDGWAVVAQGDGTQSYLCAGTVDDSLLGKRGWAMLDKEGRFVTLLPDESSCVTAVVERKEAYYLYLRGRGRFSLSEDTKVYTGSNLDGAMSTYKESMADLRSGSVVTLYLDEKGGVAGLYRAAATTESRFLIASNKTAGPDAFRALTGDDSDYTVRKNGVTVPISAIRPYDVVTYDPISKVLDVCDVRLTCVYENASPSPSAPKEITAAGGNTFAVMSDAMEDFAGRKIGDPVTLLFTSSGRVAGVLPKDAGNVTSQALGVMEGDGLRLLGCELTLDVEDGAISSTEAGIFNARSGRRGQLILEAAGARISAQFNTVDMTLNKMRVDPNVQVYERTLSGLVVREVADMPASVTAEQYHKGSAGMIDLIIVSGYSGEGYKYGRIDVANGYQLKKIPPAAPGGKTKWQLDRLQGLVFTTKDGTENYDNIVGGLHSTGYGTVLNYNGSTSVTYLQEIPNVRSSAFYTRGGVTYVQTSKGVFPVDEDVVCFNKAASTDQTGTPPDWVQFMLSHGGTWEGEDPPRGAEEDGYRWSPEAGKAVKFGSLGECRSYSDTLTVYVDFRGQRVRVVEADG